MLVRSVNVSEWEASGIYSHLERLFGLNSWRRLPSCSELNSLWKASAPAAESGALQFVPQDENLPYPELNYAQRITQSGLIATRAHNWHDVFNALTWLSFPQTKLAITQRLGSDADTETGRNRTVEHNALTLFDECAVILACADPGLLELHATHSWHALFVQRRAAWGTLVQPVVFGHGLYDQARKPYLGLTAKAWYEPVPAGWLSLPPVQLQTLLDERLASVVAGELTSPRQLLPLPVLGVPGWWQANTDPVFYDNVDYFRPKPG